jgi:hypothetical protein
MVWPGNFTLRGLAFLAGGALAANSLLIATALGQAEAGAQPPRSSPSAIGPSDTPRGATAFRISVDGAVVDKSGSAQTVDAPRRTDVGLSAVDIGVKFDGLEVKPQLAVDALPMADGQVSFRTRANYPAYITRAELRVQPVDGSSPLAVVPVAINGQTAWVPPAAGGNLTYVLRVYDGQGRFDETAPRLLGDQSAVDLTEDAAILRAIPVSGGAVTVYGRGVPAGYAVEAFSETIALDAERNFVVQRILPAGDHHVAVALVGARGGDGLQFSRAINIPDNDWFYVALADLTVGLRTGDSGIEAVRPGDYERVYSKGRLAFYLKGKIKGEYLLTAAADTDERELHQLFTGLDERNPRSILRQLDPNAYYPVYGDDSTLVEDAPTNGKFYVRLERGDSHVMWGNYKTTIAGTEFLRSERALYGANALYQSEESTQFGERRSAVTLYAAMPDTLPQWEEFLATGGSAYFLGRQNIHAGSETLTVEVRDTITGRVIQRQTLAHGRDYSIDYLQGVVILKRPLAWQTGTTGPVRDGAMGGNTFYLTAQYEFVPGIGNVDGYAYGGRIQHWLNETVRVGVTGMSETTGAAPQTGIGADITLRYSADTYLRAEIARSHGPGIGRSRSGDGGLTWGHDGTSGSVDGAATAGRLEGQLGLADLGGGLAGKIGGYVDRREAGFASLTTQTDTDQWFWGLYGDVALTDQVALSGRYDDFSDGNGQRKRQGEGSASWQLDEYWTASAGLTYTELLSPRATLSGKAGHDGARTDGGIRIEHQWDEQTRFYGFGQATLGLAGDISRNDRVGAGAEFRLSPALSVSGEVSFGTHGVGAMAGLGFDPNADEHYYLGYRLDPSRSQDLLDKTFDLVGQDGGSVVFGLKRRLNEYASAYAETGYDMFGAKRSLAQTYGILLRPDSLWTIDVGLVAGHVRDTSIDPGTGKERADFDRYAPSLSLAYVDDDAGIKAHGRGEVRIEQSSDGSRDQNTYLFAGGLSWQTSPDWRFIGNVDAVVSDATTPQTAFQDTHYLETTLGYAYRPVENDRLNALFRYTWLYDLPGNNQRIAGAMGDLFAPGQRSHILSVDVDYDLLPWLSIGAKYGLRHGEVRQRTGGGSGGGFEDDWQLSSAHLGIVRADLHVVKNWDLLLEGRVMHMPQAQTTDLGALAALYHHLGDNFKVGIGYNFGQFSDDLRDLTFNDRGAFLNVVAKF